MAANVEVSIVQGPLGAAGDWDARGGGAAVVFEGVVRRLENEREIDGLMYEAYRPMAENQIEKIAMGLIARHGLLAMRVEHSTGWVPVGKCSFRLYVASMHRQEALAAMSEFIDLLKKDVPIWKSQKTG